MSLLGLNGASRAQEDPAALMRKGMRVALMALGVAIMVVGAPIALLPWLHLPGALLVAVGLALVLRNSFSARRTFIKAQRRHPKIVFPIRRLIRREPEVIPVFWQQSLRLEQLIVPRRMRVLRRLRMALRRKPRLA
jgi:hypothetical protein